MSREGCHWPNSCLVRHRIDGHDDVAGSSGTGEANFRSMIVEVRRTFCQSRIHEGADGLDRPSNPTVGMFPSYEDRLVRGKTLAAARDSKQDLVTEAHLDSVSQRLDRRRLVAGGLEWGDELEVRHPLSLPTRARTEQVF